MASYYSQLIKILREHNCQQIPGGKGSHEKWRSSINGVVVTVPRGTKSRHTANAVLTQMGLPKKF